MDVVGSEIGQKMRSAIKAKLTELGCYVDDELPDYVMVMVANKRTRAQMEDDLQLFLGDNTELFVNWLHQVLKKLQEVTVTPLKTAEAEKNADRAKSKERKSKEKKEKDKSKKSELKKAKKKEKEKSHRKKEDKKAHKSKKKSKHHEIIRPNIPPLLMNIEKESEPSITDVFAGQILKSHGITIETLKDDKIVETKPVVKDTKRPILPIIDPSTISSQPDPDSSISNTDLLDSQNSVKRASVSSQGASNVEQIKEINEIEAKIQGLKQKLADQLDSMSEDEDFLNIRTEAEELMNDFAEDVFQEITQQAPIDTPPIQAKSPSPAKEVTHKDPGSTETLPQIELKLPKRPVRERLGAREERPVEVERRHESPERFTPEPMPEFVVQNKSAKSRLSDPPEKRISISDDASSEKSEPSLKRLTSKVSALEARAGPASVVRVRPRPRGPAPAPALLLRAVADAHRSLLNIPPKVDSEPQKVKRALVLPMRRGEQKIVIQVPADRARVDSPSDNLSLDVDSEEEKRVFGDTDRDEYVPSSLTMKVKNTDYVPSRPARTASRKDDSLIIETINIHNPTIDKDKNTQFIVTMDGYHPNAFLAKKLLTEGLIDDEDEVKDKSKDKDTENSKEAKKCKEKVTPEKSIEKPVEEKKRFSNENVESNTQVVKHQEVVSDKDKEHDSQDSKKNKSSEKRKSDVKVKEEVKSPPVKKRRASPIVFDVDKKGKDAVKERERTESASSDNHVIVTTAANSHKYDALPPLSQAERKPVWCRAFPACRYGAACAFQHPRCKFAAACTRRACAYAHLPPPPAPAPKPPPLSSQVVPAANYKSISAAALPSMCKYYPACANPACPFFHPKPCRYGSACLNKLECNFYHADLPTPYAYPL